ncbi:argininosuccinate lyase [Paracandidimonas soli]|uniref:Argininosuccinate lyase n=1 Tax=Paracandidimonas soli TaxID=1917182 RepID=A0A4R3UQU3_9BURK|nr:argininosuccinate lyase [Paracandidimonas soli]TCU93171.1 argininosuccinate lyase [Paracandidimonas soli]
MSKGSIYGKVAKGEPYRKAGARLTEDAEEVQYRTKLGDPVQQMREFKIYHQFDKAHLVMLTEQGFLKREDARKMLKALREMEQQGVETVRAQTEAGEHSGEAWLITELGEDIGGRIHAGRSSGDFMAVTSRIFIREFILKLMAASIALRKRLLAMAGEHIDTVMPASTWSQHAQPTSFAHYVMSWELSLENDFSRLKQLYERVNMSPAGAAIMTGSRYPIKRERTAELLGFDGVISNTRYAVLGFDGWLGVPAEAYTVPALLMMNVSGIASELYLWSTTEFSYVELADRYCGTSSIMPQKKNPYTLMWIRGAAARTYGHLASYLYEMHDVCMGYTRQLAPTLDDVLEATEIMTGVLDTLTIKKDRMLENATNLNWICATDIADIIVMEKGLPFRTAHQIVAILVRIGISRGLTQTGVTSALVDEAAVEYMGQPLGLGDELIRKALNPSECIKARTLTGGPAPERVEDDIARAKARCTDDEASLDAMGKRLSHAADSLEEAIDNILTA